MENLPLAPAASFPGLRAMTDEAVGIVRAETERLLQFPQVPFVTEHLIHNKTYHRTVQLPFGTEATGVLVKIPTTLTLVGDAEVFTGYEIVRICGVAVLPARAHRRQAFKVYSPTLTVVMAFPTEAKTVAEAEAEFTDDLHLLVPLDAVGRHRITITGE